MTREIFARCDPSAVEKIVDFLAGLTDDELLLTQVIITKHLIDHGRLPAGAYYFKDRP